MKIVTSYYPKPMPFRHMDWQAIDDDTYDGAEDSRSVVGLGATEQEAIDDLKEQLELAE